MSEDLRADYALLDAFMAYGRMLAEELERIANDMMQEDRASRTDELRRDLQRVVEGVKDLSTLIVIAEITNKESAE